MSVVAPENSGSWWVDQRSFPYEYKREQKYKKGGVKGNTEVVVAKQDSWMLVQVLKEQKQSLANVDVNFRRLNQAQKPKSDSVILSN